MTLAMGREGVTHPGAGSQVPSCSNAFSLLAAKPRSAGSGLRTTSWETSPGEVLLVGQEGRDWGCRQHFGQVPGPGSKAGAGAGGSGCTGGRHCDAVLRTLTLT